MADSINRSVLFGLIEIKLPSGEKRYSLNTIDKGVEIHRCMDEFLFLWRNYNEYLNFTHFEYSSDNYCSILTCIVNGHG